MEIKAPFYLSNNVPNGLLDLLKKTVLGTNGAQYQHLHTEEIINDLDDALHLYLKRDKLIANVTFCQRDSAYYIRYFAFNNAFQSKNKISKRKKNGLKETLTTFFSAKIKESKRFYAYIEPTNTKSLNFAKQFDFKQLTTLNTIIFSRIKTKENKSVCEIIGEQKNALTKKHFSQYNYFSEFQPKRTRMFGIKIGDDFTTFCRVQEASWRIHRFPGKMGGILIKILPYIPLLNKLIKPKKHSFLAVDLVYAQNKKELTRLFEHILHCYNRNSLFWWIDSNDHQAIKVIPNKLGLLSKIIRKTNVQLVERSTFPKESNLPYFIQAIDLI